MVVLIYGDKKLNLGLMEVKSDSPVTLSILSTGKSSIIVKEKQAGSNATILVARAFNEIREIVSSSGTQGIGNITHIIDRLKEEPALDVEVNIRSVKSKKDIMFYFSYMATLYSLEAPYRFEGSVYSLKEGGYEIKLQSKAVHGRYFAMFFRIQGDKIHYVNQNYKGLDRVLEEILDEANTYTQVFVNRTYEQNFTDYLFNRLKSHRAISGATMAKRMKRSV